MIPIILCSMRSLDFGRKSARPTFLCSWRQLPSQRTQGHEHILEDMIADAPAQRDAFRLVEPPVDAQIDSALAVLIFSLGKRRETAREQRAKVSAAVPGDSIKLIGHECEGDIIPPINLAQCLE